MKKRRFLMALAAMSVALGVVLCGCGTARKSTPRSSAPAPASKSQAASAPAQPDESQDESASAGGSTVRERLEKLRNGQDGSSSSGSSSSKSSSSSGNNTDNNKTADKNSVEAIAAIAEMKADVEGSNQIICSVDTGNGHNPYDVVWDYGSKYNKFVEAVDDAGMWDILFDAKFYKEHYPMLALQYHDDKDLLLEHFQTVGIHEGRQGSDAFNVAAYMENCDSKLVKAFGEHYECYY